MKIISQVCGFYCITETQLYSNTRKLPVPFARQVIMYILKEYYHYTFSKAGAVFGLDHATAIFSYRKISGLLEVDKEFKKEFKQLMKLIKNEMSLKRSIIAHCQEYGIGRTERKNHLKYLRSCLKLYSY